MSLDHLDSQITDLRAKAERHQSQWNRVVQNINADSSLSDSGKRDQINSEYQAYKGMLDQLRDKEKALVTNKQESLERSLFGLSGVASSDPNQIIAYRDARDRAARLNDIDEARALYDTAVLSGDRSLAVAVLARAVANNWRSIIEDHGTRHPIVREELKDLEQIHKYDRFQRTMTYMIMRPNFAGV